MKTHAQTVKLPVSAYVVFVLTIVANIAVTLIILKFYPF